MNSTIDLHAYRCHLGTVRRQALNDWLRTEGLIDLHVVRIELGEGHVVIERRKGVESIGPHAIKLFKRELDENGDPVTFTEIALVNTMPPREAFDYICTCSL